MSQNNRPVAVAWYRRPQWEARRQVADDKDSLDTTYVGWQVGAEKTVQELSMAVAQVRRIEVDVDELVKWCRHRGLQNTAAARSQYVAELAARSDKSTHLHAAESER